MRTACPGMALVAVMASAAAGAAEKPRPPAARTAREVARAPVAERVLDLAFVDDERVAVLAATSVSLYERKGDALALRDRVALEAPIAVRAPAGVLTAAAGEAAVWVATNRAEGALLFTIDDGRLHEIERASALPWPGGAQGARFHAGTDLVDVAVPGLGDGPHLRAGGGDPAWAIAPDGRFGVAPSGWTQTRVGSAAARVWPGTWIASSPEPPGPADAVLLLADTGAGAPAAVARYAVEGSVTALAARPRGDRALVAVAAAGGGTHRLVLLEIARED